MTKDEIRQAALSVYFLDDGPFSDLSEKDAVEVFRFYFRNRWLIRDAQFMVRNGYKYFSDHYPDRARDVIASGIISVEEATHEDARARNERPYKKRKGKVYLMRNNRNGFTKIGFSFNPKSREGTLQSEEPEIELMAFWDGNMEGETILHQRFKDKRIRGEWFSLDGCDIQEIEKMGNAGALIA